MRPLQRVSTPGGDGDTRAPWTHDDLAGNATPANVMGDLFNSIKSSAVEISQSDASCMSVHK